MTPIFKYFVITAAVLTTACSSAMAAPVTGLCGKMGSTPVDHILIEANRGQYDAPMLLSPDDGPDQDPEGTSKANTPNSWNTLQEESPTSLTLHCIYDQMETKVKLITLPATTQTCTATADKDITCK